MVRYRMLCFAYWSGTDRFVLLNGPVQNGLFCFNGPVQDALFCLKSPVQNALFCLMDPEDGTHGSQPGNHRLPLQGTAGSQRLELTVANVGTTGYHCKQLPVPRGWNS